MSAEWIAAVAWWRSPPLPAYAVADWEKYLTGMRPTWVDVPAYLSTTESPEPLPRTLQEGHPEHLLSKRDDGAIICTCGLVIPQPDGMPNYDGAAMGDW